MSEAKTSGAASQPQIDEVLGSVRRQIRLRNTYHYATIGLAIGCVLAVVMAIIHLLVPAVPTSWAFAALLVGGPLGALWAAFVPVRIDDAARRVDEYYVLKDRAITAIQFAQSDADPVKQMQVDDAAKHLRQVRAQDCVSVTPDRPKLWFSAVMAASVIAIVLFAKSRSSDSLAAAPLAVAIDQASSLRETMLPELERLQQEQPDEPELDALQEQLEELVDEMERESMDERDLMATLSEMEQAIASVREAMQMDMSDAQFQNLASAMKPSSAMNAAAAAMEEGDYDKAAEKLEAVDPSKLGDKERRAVADNLKKFLSKLSPGQQGQLSQAAQQLQDGLQNKDSSKCKDGMCKLAGLCKKQGNCKKVGQCMSCMLNRLSQCKSQCRGACNKPGSKVAKTNQPSQKWGKGSSGEPNGGESTKLASSRQQEQLDGQQGDGPSESEIMEAPEGEQSASRAYAAKYKTFRNQAEAVLDQEPLPLGHRETVQQYFESIRPDNGPDDDPYNDIED